MTQEANYLNAGKLVLFSAGEYSNYTWRSCFVATQTVSFDEVEKIAKDINDKRTQERERIGWNEGCAKTDFIMQLIGNGWLVEVDITERWTGSYEELEISE